MKDGVWWFILLVAVAGYLMVVLPIRVKLCERQNMTAVWYLDGCVIKTNNQKNKT